MAKQDDALTSAMSSAWVQPDGPNTQVYRLACSEIGDVVIPKGDVTQYICRDAHKNQFSQQARLQSPAERTTTSVTARGMKTAAWLEKQGACPMPVYINQYDCGRIDSFGAAIRTSVLPWALVTQQTGSSMSTRDTAVPSESMWDVTSQWAQHAYPLQVEALTSGTVRNITDIAFVKGSQCLGACGPRYDSCRIGYYGCDCAALGASDVFWSHDYGVTWTAYANTPWVAGLVAQPGNFVKSIITFPIGDGTVNRVMCTRDNADAVGLALDVAYSDDEINWDHTIVGAAADVATGPGALFALNERNVWMCWTNAAGNAGYIAKSTDGGMSWTTQATGLGNAMNCIRFLDEDHGICVGDTEEIQITHNGGTTWAAPVGLPGKAGVDILACDILDSMRFWVAFEDGDLYFTRDGGITWSERVFSMPPGITTAVYSINDLKFVDDYCGYFTLDYVGLAAAVFTAIYRTIDGGLTWLPYLPGTSGYAWEAIWPCGYNECYMVGDLTGAVGQIHRAYM